MPLAVDLSGMRFGNLVAVSLASRDKAGGSNWICLCDCGNEDIVNLRRLRVPDEDPRSVRACSECRSRKCAVCGSLFLKSGSAKTCGASQCRLEYRRATNQSIYADTQAAIGKLPRSIGSRHRAVRNDPLMLMFVLEAERLAAAEARQQLTEADLAHRRARRREQYRQNPEKFQNAFKAWRDSLSPARRAEWTDRVNQRSRRFRAAKQHALMMRDAAALLNLMERTDD